MPTEPPVTAEGLLEEAENQGLLVPLETAATEMGKTPKEILDAAQAVPALAGKTPENLARLLQDKKNRDLLVKAMNGTTQPSGEEEPPLKEEPMMPSKSETWKDSPGDLSTNLFPVKKKGK